MATVLFALSLCGSGYFILAAGFPLVERRDRLIAAFPMGAGAFTLAVFCAHQFIGLALSRTLLVASAAGLLAASCAAAALARGAHGAPENPGVGDTRHPMTPRARAQIGAVLCLVGVLSAVGILVPVAHWDVNAEYLPLIHHTYVTRALPTKASPCVVEVVNAFPPGYTLLAAAGWILHGGILHPWVRALSPLYAVLLLLLLHRMGTRHLGLSEEMVSGGLLLCLSLPIFADYMIVPASTICFCFHAVAALYFILEYLRERRREHLFLAGVFLGLSYWISYTGTVLGACLAALLLVCAGLGMASGDQELRRLRMRPSDFLLLFLPAAAIALPHLIRNFSLYGNPLYPVLYNRIGGVWLNDWSIAHLIPRLIPARTFFLRPRWEIFHEGFFISLLFVLSLASVSWRRRARGFACAFFCILYWVHYLSFLTWPRSSGISIKLLLPALIPASLFAGERLDRILSGRLPSWQWAVILCLVPVWAAVMLGDYAMLPSVRGLLPPRHPASLIKVARAFFFDFDKLLIWAGVAGCLAGGLARSAPARRLFGALLLFGFVSRPLAEGVSLLADHASAWTADRGYSFWNAPVFPSLLPERQWLDLHLPPNAVIGSFDNRTYLYPRPVVPLDSPPLWPMYRGLDADGCIALLEKQGVTHLCLSEYTAKPHPLYDMSPLFTSLGDPSRLPLLYGGSPGQGPRHALKVYRVRPAGEKGRR